MNDALLRRADQSRLGFGQGAECSARSPAAIASSTLRIAERMRERRDLLTMVRRAA